MDGQTSAALEEKLLQTHSRGRQAHREERGICVHMPTDEQPKCGADWPSPTKPSEFLSSLDSSVQGTEGSTLDRFCLWELWLPGAGEAGAWEAALSLQESQGSPTTPAAACWPLLTLSCCCVCLPRPWKTSKLTPRSIFQEDWEHFELLTKSANYPNYQTLEIIPCGCLSDYYFVAKIYCSSED